MQQDENYMYNGVNGQQIDAIQMGYTRRSGSVQIHPDRPPISVRARIGSNSTVEYGAEWPVPCVEMIH